MKCSLDIKCATQFDCPVKTDINNIFVESILIGTFQVILSHNIVSP